MYLKHAPSCVHSGSSYILNMPPHVAVAVHHLRWTRLLMWGFYFTKDPDPRGGGVGLKRKRGFGWVQPPTAFANTSVSHVLKGFIWALFWLFAGWKKQGPFELETECLYMMDVEILKPSMKVMWLTQLFLMARCSWKQAMNDMKRKWGLGGA